MDNKVFTVFFHNPNYENSEQFLMSGSQSNINKNIKKIAHKFNNKKDLSTIIEIYNWTHKNIKPGRVNHFERTSSEIIRSKVAAGCSDIGLVFVALARAKGIPAVYVQTADTNWIQDLINNKKDAYKMVKGHILVEIKIKDNWLLLDSTRGKLYLDYDKHNPSLDDNYYVFAKSLDMWETGITNIKENNATMIELFKDFDLSKYRKPNYNYYDIKSDSLIIDNKNQDKSKYKDLAIEKGYINPGYISSTLLKLITLITGIIITYLFLT